MRAAEQPGTPDRRDRELGGTAYDRSGISPGIMHIGVGHFHRGHQAAYLDALMEQGLAQDFGIIGVGVLPTDRKIATTLNDQDGLYTLTVAHPDGRMETRTIGSLIGMLFAPDDPQAVLARMSDPATRIVSLTISEDGYPVDPDTRRFAAQHPAVQADLQTESTPQSAIGFIVEALRRRHETGMPPFTVLSCDDMPGNGDITRMVITAFARAKDPDLADWIDATVRFPNCVADRVTRAATADDIDAAQTSAGDGLPVLAEPWTQWVIEDDFPLGRPPYEQIGVQLTDNVVPYALAKLRLADTARAALGYGGYLAGHRYAHEACQDRLLTDFLLGYLHDEAVPTLPPVPGVDLQALCGEVIERLANRGLRTPLADLCANGSATIPALLVPVIEDIVRARGPLHHCALIVAAWARYAEGVDEQGAPIEVIDDLVEPLQTAVRGQRDDPLVLLRNPMLFGGLIDTPEFTGPYADTLRSLHTNGIRQTLEAVCHGRPRTPR